MFLGNNEIKKTVQVPHTLTVWVYFTVMLHSWFPVQCVTRIPSESRKFNVNNYNIMSSIKLV